MTDFGAYDDPPPIAELYDWVPAYIARPDQRFYLDLCAQAPDPILELGCGTGRILIPAAAVGHSVVGLDSSRRMLEQCRRNLEQETEQVRSRVELVHTSMTDFDLGRTFSLIIAPFRSFQHLLCPEEQLSCLRCANRHLEVGGRLVLDVYHVDLRFLEDPAGTMERVEFWDVELPGGRTLKRTHRIASFHRAEQYNQVELIYYVREADGSEERMVHSFPMRYFFRYEIEHLLARCGFGIEELFGDFNRSPLSNQSPEMIFIAVKRRNPAE
jgi:SAM-dependent methyltransferase